MFNTTLLQKTFLFVVFYKRRDVEKPLSNLKSKGTFWFIINQLVSLTVCIQHFNYIYFYLALSTELLSFIHIATTTAELLLYY